MYQLIFSDQGQTWLHILMISLARRYRFTTWVQRTVLLRRNVVDPGSLKAAATSRHTLLSSHPTRSDAVGSEADKGPDARYGDFGRRGSAKIGALSGKENARANSRGIPDGAVALELVGSAKRPFAEPAKPKPEAGHGTGEANSAGGEGPGLGLGSHEDKNTATSAAKPVGLAGGSNGKGAGLGLPSPFSDSDATSTARPTLGAMLAPTSAFAAAGGPHADGGSVAGAATEVAKEHVPVGGAVGEAEGQSLAWDDQHDGLTAAGDAADVNLLAPQVSLTDDYFCRVWLSVSYSIPGGSCMGSLDGHYMCVACDTRLQNCLSARVNAASGACKREMDGVPVKLTTQDTGHVRR